MRSDPCFLPHGADIEKVLDNAQKVARGLGLDDARAYMMSIKSSGITILVRGLTRDPRRGMK